MKLGIVILLTCLVTLCCGSVTFASQAREHLTEQEIDLVKDAQVLDKRIDIFIKAVDRRLLVINGASSADATSTKQLKKDSETWGELPKGSRAELIGDIAGIFDEAITNIDDVSTRDENNPLIPKSLRKLAAEATRVVEILKPVAKNDAESLSFDQLTENAEQIVQAATKLPPPVEKKGKGKTEKAKE
jgi:hypothetical protein